MIRLLRILFFLYAGLWLAFAAATLLRLLPGGPEQAPAAGIVVALMLALLVSVATSYVRTKPEQS